MKRLVIILTLLIIITYVGFYLNKKFQFYGIKDYPVGVKDDYILHQFHEAEGKAPESELEIKEFISVNDTLFTGNLMAKYLTEQNFLLKYDTNLKRYYIYDVGYNYLDDKLETETNLESVNVFNYLFSSGDILIFYSDEIDKRRIYIDAETSLPPNVTIKVIK